jgi:hypothetical protein
MKSVLLKEGSILDPSYEIGVTSLVIIAGAGAPCYRVPGKAATDHVGRNFHLLLFCTLRIVHAGI